tara:strand:+ start:126 stop:383 length:258 start_codon:yes stop_codon:yes gene_type:complete
MKITKRQLRRIIREEKARILVEQQLNPEIATVIQATATDAARNLDQLSNQVDVKLMDAGLNELAIDIRNAVELLDKIRRSAYNLR